VDLVVVFLVVARRDVLLLMAEWLYLVEWLGVLYLLIYSKECLFLVGPLELPLGPLPLLGLELVEVELGRGGYLVALAA
jgi:hypothetical protein